MLTIHAGLPKTGSTAIQRNLAAISTRSIRGIHYRGKFSAANNDGFKTDNAVGFSVPEKANETLTVRRLGKGRDVVLSDEDFFGSTDRWVGATYDQAAINAAAIRDYFGGKSQFRIVIYVRAQQDWLESLYTEYAKKKKTPDALDSAEFARLVMDTPYFNWSRLITDLKEQVGPERLIVRPYRAWIETTSDFLSVLGIPQIQHTPVPMRENSSLAPGRLALQQ